MDSIAQMLPDKWRFLYTILFFPVGLLLWSFEDSGYILFLKILFLAIPLLFLCVAIFCSLVSLVTVVFRPNRTFFIATVLITWWDGGKAILTYWAGIFRFLFLSVGWIFGALRVIVFGTFQTIKDILFLPLTILTRLVKGYSAPGIPWIAVMITFFWIACEAITFSYILNGLVVDIIAGLTNKVLPDMLVMSGLFVFLFMLIGGSFACMHGLVEAFENKKVVTIIKMLVIEFFVMAIEVMFFYREFVDSLAPWFAQLSNDTFHMGPIMVVTIAGMAWFGIRSGTWFFFAKYGTPTLLMIISREGIERGEESSPHETKHGVPLSWIKELTHKFQSELNWFSEKSIDIVAAFVLPPVQVLAVMTNFFMILLTGKNLFVLPIKSMDELKNTKQMLEQISEKKE